MTTNTQPAEAGLRGAARAGQHEAREMRRDVRVFSSFGHIALVLWAIIVIVPILWTFLASFKNTAEIFSSPWTLPAELRVENWSRA